MLRVFSGLSVHGHLERQAPGGGGRYLMKNSHPLVSKATMIVSHGRSDGCTASSIDQCRCLLHACHTNLCWGSTRDPSMPTPAANELYTSILALSSAAIPSRPNDINIIGDERCLAADAAEGPSVSVPSHTCTFQCHLPFAYVTWKSAFPFAVKCIPMLHDLHK